MKRPVIFIENYCIPPLISLSHKSVYVSSFISFTPHIAIAIIIIIIIIVVVVVVAAAVTMLFVVVIEGSRQSIENKRSISIKLSSWT